MTKHGKYCKKSENLSVFNLDLKIKTGGEN